MNDIDRSPNEQTIRRSPNDQTIYNFNGVNNPATQINPATPALSGDKLKFLIIIIMVIGIMLIQIYYGEINNNNSIHFNNSIRDMNHSIQHNTRTNYLMNNSMMEIVVQLEKQQQKWDSMEHKQQQKWERMEHKQQEKYEEIASKQNKMDNKSIEILIAALNAGIRTTIWGWNQQLNDELV